MKIKRSFSWVLLFLCVWCLDLFLLHTLRITAVVGNLRPDVTESDVFRKQDISVRAYERMQELSEQTEIPLMDLMTVFMVMNRFELEDDAGITEKEFYRGYAILTKYRPEEYVLLKRSYTGIWKNLTWFPVAADSKGTTRTDFEDSWMSERTYQGQRHHEGCDIFCAEQEGETPAGYYPVVSVTDGFVENIGWLPLGGYRIGIRSPDGGYFYYAHLFSYERDFQVGEAVCSGEVLGLMGDSG